MSDLSSNIVNMIYDAVAITGPSKCIVVAGPLLQESQTSGQGSVSGLPISLTIAVH